MHRKRARGHRCSQDDKIREDRHGCGASVLLTWTEPRASSTSFVFSAWRKLLVDEALRGGVDPEEAGADMIARNEPDLSRWAIQRR
jgi:hypothetical protein